MAGNISEIVLDIETVSRQKACTKCGESKNLSEFYFHKVGRKAGKPLARCIKCSNECSRDWSHRNGYNRPYSEVVDCSTYLGVHIAERMLSRYFDEVQRMPYGNPGYDFVCKRGYKIDVKSSCKKTYSVREYSYVRWNFNIRRNQIANYFLCLAFDGRESLNPEHIWLFPSGLLCDKTALQINDNETSILRWSAYEKPLGKVVMCCDAMKAGAI